MYFKVKIKELCFDTSFEREEHTAVILSCYRTRG